MPSTTKDVRLQLRNIYGDECCWCKKPMIFTGCNTAKDAATIEHVYFAEPFLKVNKLKVNKLTRLAHFECNQVRNQFFMDARKRFNAWVNGWDEKVLAPEEKQLISRKARNKTLNQLIKLLDNTYHSCDSPGQRDHLRTYIKVLRQTVGDMSTTVEKNEESEITKTSDAFTPGTDSRGSGAAR